jgi:hypothetical protein
VQQWETVCMYSIQGFLAKELCQCPSTCIIEFLLYFQESIPDMHNWHKHWKAICMKTMKLLRALTVQLCCIPENAFYDHFSIIQKCHQVFNAARQYLNCDAWPEWRLPYCKNADTISPEALWISVLLHTGKRSDVIVLHQCLLSKL